MGWLTRNWHLKLAALGLATILYTGFVYSGSFTDQLFPGLPIEAINQPSGAYPLTQQLGTVDVQYRLSADAPERVTADSFAVTVDLAGYDMARSPELQSLTVRVESLQRGLEVLEFQPTTVPVALDRLAESQVPVEVETGDLPEGLAISAPRTSHEEVTASGPQTQLGRVVRAVARVQIFASGIDVRQPQVPLVPVDIDGREVESVELEPATIQVEIDVRTVETSKTVPIRPDLAGNPADGFQVSAVTVDPVVVTIFGAPDVVADITEVTTEPIPIGGANADLELDATLDLPEGTRTAEDAPAAVVTVSISPSIATRNYLVGVTCEGAPNGSACLPQQEQLSVTLRGPAAELADINPADLTPTLDASGLGPGSHTLTPTFSLPNGVDLVSVSPGSVTVQIVPPATPSPAPG
ncbi:MAG TPA: CdaR family protein [Candidatus Limnocylindria bacterium]|nr:CdaR family protein [Candidatus Limnocylindria bacterium]